MAFHGADQLTVPAGLRYKSDHGGLFRLREYRADDVSAILANLHDTRASGLSNG